MLWLSKGFRAGPIVLLISSLFILLADAFIQNDVEPRDIYHLGAGRGLDVLLNDAWKQATGEHGWESNPLATTAAPGPPPFKLHRTG